VETGPWGTRWFRAVFESMVRDLYGDVFVYALLLPHRKPELLPCHFSYPLEIGHLKLHTVGDVNLSHSLVIVCECAGSVLE
jgi:hypothetical protein